MRSNLGRFHRPMSRGLVNNMLMMNNLGDGSTLNLDFTTGVLDPRLTFTRSTTATYINSSGYVTTMGAAPTNDPTKARFDYSPTNIGEPRGLLVEGVGINVLKSSEELLVAQGYGEQDILSRTTGTSPSNGTAVGFYPTTVSGYHRVQSPYVTGLSGAYTVSIWYKRLNSSLRAGINANAMLNVGAVFDLNGAGSVVTLGGSAANKAATITAYPNDWYRVTVTGTRVTDNSVFFFMAGSSQTDFDGGSPFVGVASQGMLMWGAQLEAGSGASSYIPTGASQVTRNADHCTIPTASFIPGNPYPQTLFVDCIPNTPSGAFLDIARIFDRTGGGAFSYGTEIYYYTASTMTVSRKIAASTNTERSFASGLAYGTRHKFALSIDASSYSGSYDGVTALGATTAPTALATVATHLGIGCTGDASPASVMFGTIRQIKFYPTALSQSAINTLTTL